MFKKLISVMVLLAMLLTTFGSALLTVSAETPAAAEDADTFSVYQRDTETGEWEAVESTADSLEKAVAAVSKNFGKIVVNRDYVMASELANADINMPALLAENKTITIEGGGHTLYVDKFQYPVNFAKGDFLVDGLNIKTYANPTKVPDAMVRIYPDADVTITNSVWEVVEGTTSKWGAVCVYGLLTVGEQAQILHNGNMVAGNYVAIQMQNRNSDNINGVTSANPRGIGVTLMNNSTLKSKGTTAIGSAGGGSIVLKGLTLDLSPVVTLPAVVDGSLKAQVAALSPEEYTALQSELAQKFSALDWTAVDPAPEKPWKVGTQTFISLSEAAEAVEAGGTVELTGNISTSAGETVNVAKAFTLNGNGHTILGIGTNAVLTVDAGTDVTVKNLIIESKDGTTPRATVLLSGKLTLDEGSKVLNHGSASGNSQCNGVRVAANDAELNVLTGAEINVVGTALVSDGFASTMTIDGGIVSTVYRFYVCNGAGAHVLNMKGGFALSTSKTEPFINKYGAELTVNISGGTINYGLESRFVQGNDTAVLNGANFTGGTIKKSGKTLICLPDIQNQDVRIRLPEEADQTNSGIAFGTRIDKRTYDEMSSSLTSFVTGTLIVPASYLEELSSFTVEALQEKYGENGFINIINDGWYNAASAETDGFYTFYGSMVNVKDVNYSREFASVGYITVSVEGIGTYTFYSRIQAGTLSALAEGKSGNDSQNAMLALFRGEV